MRTNDVIPMVFPSNKTQPEFGRALVSAAKAGVEIIYNSCHVEADSIKITGGTLDTSRYRNAKIGNE